MSGPKVLDLYAGMGGWSVALRDRNMESLGLELDKDALATREAAGFRSDRQDIASAYPGFYTDYANGLVASPPCQSFSAAGKGAGRVLKDRIAAQALNGDWRDWDGMDERSTHVLVTGYWIETLRPTWFACEQVPAVLPIWEAIAKYMSARHGYSCWAGVLNAADYGLPQTRKRAILVGRRWQSVSPPTPTHAKNPEGDLKPWVSMAEALGWGFDTEPSAAISGGGTATGGAEPFANANYRARLKAHVLVTRDGPPWAMTGRARSWVLQAGDQANATRRTLDQPAATIRAGHDRAGRWVSDDLPEWARTRPATTVVASFRPDILAGPGWRKAGDGPRQNAAGSVQVTHQEALVLQGFPADYPVQGSKTAKFRQIGNAIPPLLAGVAIDAARGISR